MYKNARAQTNNSQNSNLNVTHTYASQTLTHLRPRTRRTQAHPLHLRPSYRLPLQSASPFARPARYEPQPVAQVALFPALFFVRFHELFPDDVKCGRTADQDERRGRDRPEKRRQDLPGGFLGDVRVVGVGRPGGHDDSRAFVYRGLKKVKSNWKNLLIRKALLSYY